MERHGDGSRLAPCACGAAHLTFREVQVLLLAAAGLSGRAIGRKLGISPRTVEDHLTVMRKHAGACGTAELVARCYAVEVLVPGWPPRWSGRTCLLGLPRPRHQPTGGHPDTGPAGSVNDDARTWGAVTKKRVRAAAGGIGVSQAGHREHPVSTDIQGTVSWNRSFTGQPLPSPPSPGPPVPETSPETAYRDGRAGTVGTMTATPAYGDVRIGYARVSTRAQEHRAQFDALAAAHCREIIVETASTRGGGPKLHETLGQLQAGDTLVIYKPDRIARSMKELLVLLEDQLHARGINLHILTGTCAGIHRPNGATIAEKMLFMVAAMVTEMERDLIRERTLDGLRAAEAQGRRGGRPPAVNDDVLAVARYRRSRGESVTVIARHLKIGRSTLYRALGPRDGVPAPVAVQPARWRTRINARAPPPSGTASHQASRPDPGRQGEDDLPNSSQPRQKAPPEDHGRGRQKEHLTWSDRRTGEWS
jgi:DNA invertase Pin-like site-specific DNA recombinase/DNA-binding CsgD family transcriptional regulator